jgi:enoyl-CoA hydratase/carnithine racemase
MTMSKILYEKRNKIGYITLNNPEKANILDRQTSDEISEAWKTVWEDRDVRVVILTGTGTRHFCAGHNLALPPGVTAEERDRIRTEAIFSPLAGSVNGARIGADGRLGDHYPQIWKPVIGAINGWAAGAGFYLMLTSTDIRIASREHARFKFALLSQGWVGGGPGATYLTRQVAHADAMRILLSDEPFDAAEALRINLINEVVPHERLIERAEEIATQIAAQPPLAVRMMKEFIIRFRDIPITEAWRVQTLMNTLLTQLTTDGDEGRAAFVEKRAPNFTGGVRQKGEGYPDLSDAEWERLDQIRRDIL